MNAIFSLDQVIARGACASLTWEYMTVCFVGRSQASGISVVLWENPAPAIHVTLGTDPFHENSIS